MQAPKENSSSFYLTKDRSRRPGGGRKPKWLLFENFIIDEVKQAWDKGMPLCKQELLLRFQLHVKHLDDPEAVKMFVDGKDNSVRIFLKRTLSKYKYSVRKNYISQSVPVDWRSKAEENTLRIRNLFKKEDVDVVINADETFVLFHMQDGRLIVPTGMKRVGTAAQVDNDKMGATVLIGCEFRTSTILPPMIIFTGVYGAKLMRQWENFEDGKVTFTLVILEIYFFLTLSSLFPYCSKGNFQ
jgi:hypothetical protein